jgi:hypothetical protein
MLPFKANRRIGRLVSLPAGGLLFLCAFMPAVRGCEQAQIYPYREVISSWSGVPFGFPHLFGLLSLVVAAFLLKADKRPVSSAATGFWAITLALSLSLGYAFIRGALENPSTGQRTCLVLLLPYSFVLYKLVRRREPSDEAPFVGRVIWTGGAMSALWYAHWLILSRPLYGLYLSFVSSLLLLLGGLLLERRED